MAGLSAMCHAAKSGFRFKASDESYGWMTLLCPVCDDVWTHLEDVGTDNHSKDERLCGRLHFSCENGCMFTIRAQQHKGQTFLMVDEARVFPRSPQPTEPTDTCPTEPSA